MYVFAILMLPFITNALFSAASPPPPPPLSFSPPHCQIYQYGAAAAVAVYTSTLCSFVLSVSKAQQPSSVVNATLARMAIGNVGKEKDEVAMRERTWGGRWPVVAKL